MTPDSPPWLSVIMPTYNGEAYLEAALQSLSDQVSQDVEIIAIDDGSTDATLSILQRWSERLPLRIVTQAHTGNWVTNTNSGIDRARGTYLCFLHQDDLWLPGRLARLRQATVRHPDVGFFLHPSCFVTSRGDRAGAWTCPLPRRGALLPPERVLPRLLIQNFIAMPAPLFKREAALKAGRMDEALWFTADWKLWLALISQGPILYLPEILAGFRIHPASQTMVGAKRPAEIARQIRVMLDEAFPVYLPGSRHGRRVRQVAEMNIELNRILSAKVHGQPAGWSRLLVSFIRLGPIGWHCFFRDSRIIQRVVARWRAGLALPPRRTPQ